jgi:predicted nucleotidyltransferase
MDIEAIKKEIVQKLKPLSPEKIVLFGSYAYGEPHEDSDIDLYVVTNDNYIPQNFEEKNQLYLKVSKQLRDLRKKIAIDLIVHSKKMNELFKSNDSSFYKYDIKNGINLI